MRDFVQLNPAQAEAVAHRGTPLLVLAGAGTGKTRVITHRVAALLREGVPPWRILAVTFTNRAAREMQGRIAALCAGVPDLHEMWVGTFHAIGARILRRHADRFGLSPSFTIYDRDDQLQVMRRAVREAGHDPRHYGPAQMLGLVDRAKQRGLGPDEAGRLGLPDPVAGVFHEVYAAYQARLAAAQAVDFGDLLRLPVDLLQGPSGGGQLGDLDPVERLRRRFLHVVVDEYQDTNPVQARLVALLAGHAELCVVGDDDQAIYGWRGADVAQILSFPRAFPNVRTVRLEQNYRSTGHILACADAIIARNRGRLGKTLYCEAGEGAKVRLVACADERDEARFVARDIQARLAEGADPLEIAVFYRTHAQSRVLEQALRTLRIPTRIFGGVSFFARAEIKDVVAYLVLLVQPHSDAHLVRVLNRPRRGIGKTTVERLSAEATRRGTSVWNVLREPDGAGLGAAARRKVGAFVQLLEALAEDARGVSLGDLPALVVERTGYDAVLDDGTEEEAAARRENLLELAGAMHAFEQENPGADLSAFLEQASLATSEQTPDDAPKVSLMTVHAAKGLEFERVYLTGLEEGVFPHARSLDEPAALEEERRLAYVALTRAKRHLVLSFAAERNLYNRYATNPPSRFLRDLPPRSLDPDGPRAEAVVGRRSRPAARPVRSEPARWDEDVVLDPGVEADLDLDPPVPDGEGVPLYVGMAVDHPTFGRGELLGWSGAGADLKLRLRFVGTGTKTILARYCRPA